MSWFRRLFEQEPQPEPRGQWTQETIAAVEMSAMSMLRVVSESMRIAFDSKSEETRRSRVRVARDNVARLLDLAADYPFLKVDNVDEVMRDLDKMDAATDAMFGAPDPLAAILPTHFDTTCGCGRQFGVPIATIADEFSCPGCGLVGQFTAEQVSAIHDVIADALATARRSLGGLSPR